MIFEGALSVKAILEGQKRSIKRVLIQDKKHSKDINYILYLCHTHNIEVQFVSNEVIQSLAIGKTHGGILIEALSREYDTLSADEEAYLCLEGIEDPYNLGTLIRTAYCSGVKTLIFPKRDGFFSEEILMKSSAGAWDRMNVVFSESLTSDLALLKSNGLKIIGAKRDEKSQLWYKSDLTGCIVLCVGGEKRGLSQEVVSLCDEFIEIRYPTGIKLALSAVSSGSIILFERARQKGV